MDDFGMGYALGQDSGSSCRDGGSGMWGGDGSWIFAFLIIALIFGGRGGLFGGGWGGNSGGYGDGINSPAGSYSNCEKYCIVVAQSIPATTTINAPVVITIGTGTQQYPLTKRNCAQVTACGIRTRTKYSTCVVTTPTGGSFRLMGNPCCAPNNNLQSIDGGATVVPSSINK